MKRLKAAVVGMGFIGFAHVEALRRIPHVDVVAIADSFGAKEKAERLGVPAGYADYVEMMDACKPDCIHICTPNSTHMAIAMAAIERGIHVVCEKPMARNAEEAQKMAAVQDGFQLEAAVRPVRQDTGHRRPRLPLD